MAHRSGPKNGHMHLIFLPRHRVRLARARRPRNPQSAIGAAGWYTLGSFAALERLGVTGRSKGIAAMTSRGFHP
jgi:hypothetical protein